MGNSEVGHLNLGAGRPVLQDLPRIDAAIADGSFFERPALLAACRRARDGPGVLHVVSLIGPGGVHANDRHLVALAELAARAGRRRGPRPRPARRPRHAAASALGFIADLEARLAAAHPGCARSRRVGGRYFAMDRDQRWERVERGYDAIVHGEGEHHAPERDRGHRGGLRAGRERRVRGPDRHRRAAAARRDGEPIIHANFRADRARQLTHALADGPAFDGFDRTAPSGRPAPDATCSS